MSVGVALRETSFVAQRAPQNVLDLRVDAAKIVIGPAFHGIVDLRVEP